MKRLLRKALALLLCLSLCISYVPFAAADNVASGTWGNLSWTLDSDGLLTISGSGEIYDFTYDNPSAWLLHRSQIISVKINSGIYSIGDYAFSYCNYLTSISIPSGVERIGRNAFINCSSLTSITIPSGVQSIGSNAFSTCRNLTSIIIPSSVTEIGTDAFIYCGGLKTAGPIGSGCDYQFGWEDTIPGNAFTGCLSLTTVTIPSGVTSIGYAAFNNCLSLTSITLPSGVESISRLAFASCSNLTSISIPSSVAIIYDNAFGSGLTDVYYEGTQVQWNAIVIESPNEGLNNATIHFNDSPTSCEHNYTTADIVNRKNPSLTESGQIVYQCTKCDALITEYYPVLNETDYLLERAVEPTCSETGRDDYTYMGNTAQHLTFSVELPIVDHDYVNGVCRFCGQTDPNGGSGYNTGSGISVFESTGDPVITSFRFYQDAESENYIDLTNSTEELSIDYNGSANPYKFEITIDNPSLINNIYVTAQSSTGVRQMDAVYDSSSGKYIAMGFFDEENIFYQPENIKLEYTPVSDTIPVGADLNWDEMVPYLGELTNANVSVNQTGNVNAGTIDFSDTISELSNMALNYTIKTVDSNFGTQFGELRNYYETGENILSYVVPGLDDSKYYAYLDFSDPKTYKMLLDDGLEIGGKLIEIEMDFLDVDSQQYLDLEDASNLLGHAATALNIIEKAHKICEDTDKLMEEIEQSPTIVDKERARKDAEELHHDKMQFMLLTKVLPLIVTGAGVTTAAAMGPAPAMLFSAIIGVMSIVSNTVYDYRVGGILGTEKTTAWYPNISRITGVQCGENAYYDCISYRIDGLLQHDLIFYGSGSTYDQYDWDISYTGYTRNIIVQNGITSLGSRFFFQFVNVRDVKLPSSLVEIGWEAFRDCTELTRISIPNGVKIIGSGAFNECTNLESIHIPDSVECINNGAFAGCESLKTIILSKTIQTLGAGVFANTGIRTVTIPNTIKEVSTTFDHYSPFDGSNVSTIVFEGGIKSIPDCFACGAEYLQRVVIPDSVETIGNSAFADCVKIESIDLPDSLICIGDSVFADCTGLTSIIIPSNVTSIGVDAFYNCSSLTDITVSSSNTEYCDINGVLFNKIKTNILKFPASRASQYSIPTSVATIGTYAFEDCSGLTSITIPPSVTNIEFGAFEGCSGLLNVTIPSSVTRIGENAFSDCSGLASITIPSSVTKIEECLFDGCSGLTSITIPMSVTSIGRYSFRGCSSLTDVYYEGTQEQWVWLSINNEILKKANVHYNSFVLPVPDFLLPAELTTIGDEAFRGSVFTCVKLSDKTAQIGAYAFADCPNLEYIYIPAETTNINANAFGNEQSLTIIGKTGSTAETFAQNHGFGFVIMA